jgi:hypothetical protein
VSQLRLVLNVSSLLRHWRLHKCVTQCHRQEAEIQRLTASLVAAPKEDVSRPGSRTTLQRLASEVGLPRQLLLRFLLRASHLQTG